MRKTNINKYLEKVKAIHGSKKRFGKIFEMMFKNALGIKE